MSRIFNRPMFKRGGSAGQGITSGLDRPGYSLGNSVDIDEVIRLKPDYANAHYLLGLAYEFLQRYNESMVSYEQAVRFNSSNANAHSNLGLTYLELGKLDDALTSCQKALTLDQRCMEAYSNTRLTIQSLSYEVLRGTRTGSSIDEIISGIPSPPEPDILRFHYKSVTGGDLAEAWQSVADTMPTVASETIKNSVAVTPSSGIQSGGGSEHKMVALFHFGRSGSGYLHSLLDDHPNVSTLPGVYMSGFFGREVWSRIISSGFEGIPERFSSLYEVLFDARNLSKVPPAFISDTYADGSVGEKEGFTAMGEDRDTPLTLDREEFVGHLSEIIQGYRDFNQGQFFEAVHAAYEQTRGRDFGEKSLIFYHLHKIDTYSLANFLKYYPEAQLLTILRNPLQSCESWAVKKSNDVQTNNFKTYADIVGKITTMLLDLHTPAYLTQSSVGIRLEDIKTSPEETMGCLCDYLGIRVSPTLYSSSMQGLKWWGDPSSSLFGRTHDTESWDDDPIRATVGSFFSDHDQLILSTLFYPLSSRFGYVETDGSRFRRDLDEIRPYLEKPLDFETTLSADFPSSYPELEETGDFKSLHAVLLGLWSLLDAQGTYPYMMEVLPGT